LRGGKGGVSPEIDASLAELKEDLLSSWTLFSAKEGRSPFDGGGGLTFLFIPFWDHHPQESDGSFFSLARF